MHVWAAGPNVTWVYFHVALVSQRSHRCTLTNNTHRCTHTFMQCLRFSVCVCVCVSPWSWYDHIIHTICSASSSPALILSAFPAGCPAMPHTHKHTHTQTHSTCFCRTSPQSNHWTGFPQQFHHHRSLCNIWQIHFLRLWSSGVVIPAETLQSSAFLIQLSLIQALGLPSPISMNSLE